MKTPFLQSFTRFYQWIAVTLLSSLLMILAFNALLGHRYRDRLYPAAAPQKTQVREKIFGNNGAVLDNGKRDSHLLNVFDLPAYGEIDEYTLSEILDDFYDLNQRGLIYQPWVQFATPIHQSRHVNVTADPRGFPLRKTPHAFPQDEKPIVPIFIFGGSTSFGWLVTDQETWPAHLSRILNEQAEKQNLPFHVKIHNYSRSFYNTSQETILFLDLLKSGLRPSLVIFMDGINIGASQDTPLFTTRLWESFFNLQYLKETDWWTFLETKKIPLLYFIRSLRERWGRPMKDFADFTQRAALQPREEPASPSALIQRFQQNQKIVQALCDLYGCKALFFLQPHNFHGHNKELFRVPPPEKKLKANTELASRVYQGLAGSPYIDLTGLFEKWGKDRKVFIDNFHYSPAFNQFLAEQVASYIPLNDLNAPQKFIDEEAATGSPRQFVETPVLTDQVPVLNPRQRI